VVALANMGTDAFFLGDLNDGWKKFTNKREAE
jgi:hypothetical protein